jgi:DNA-binding CsgD family transcriptional regulator
MRHETRDGLTIIERVALLTEGQKQCLRLVRRDMSSKQIGRQIAKSPHTVDSRLKSAIAVLGASDRFEAAKLLRDVEGGSRDVARAPSRDYQPLVYQASDIPIATQFSSSVSSPQDISEQGDGVQNELFEVQAQYLGEYADRSRSDRIWSFLLRPSRENTLSIPARLSAIVLIAVLAVFGLASLVSVAEGLSRIR